MTPSPPVALIDRAALAQTLRALKLSGMLDGSALYLILITHPENKIRKVVHNRLRGAPVIDVH
ncbi:hypothetical protein BCD48_38305 [Pseudofrankia sp. BMG5.36]|nr:hypothetical protein BCD48_38305 [Pseudofrankia sp. BMG5.36]